MTTLWGCRDESASFTLLREVQDLPLVARFTVDGEPMSKARARVVNGHAYTPERTRVAEAGIQAAFKSTNPSRTPHPLLSGTKYGVVALFFHQTRQRRDIDNMLKLILDALNGMAWTDDTQVVEISARKVLVPKGEARTEVAIYEVEVFDPNVTTCELCHKPVKLFDSWPGRRRWCSAECMAVTMAAERVAKLRRNCERCGREFESADARYCSKECREMGHVVTLDCAYCGCSFRECVSWRNKGLQFCSLEHHAAYWRERRAAHAKGVCKACGGTVSKKSYTRCRPCALEKRPLMAPGTVLPDDPTAPEWVTILLDEDA